MKRTTLVWTRTLLVLAAFAMTACSDHTPTELPWDHESAAQTVDAAQAFTVYSQNLYLGGETAPLFTLDLTNPVAVIAATQQFWGEVKGSAVPDRMAEVVDEIAVRRPHLVGLQEAAQFLVLDMAAGGAVIDRIDLLAEIQQRISERGLPYEVAAIQNNTTVTLPLSPTTVLRASERIAVLRRTDVTASSIAQGAYAAAVPLGPFSVRRGWIRFDTSHEGIDYHFVTTHLETQRVPVVQAAQANELINGVTAGLDGVTIVTGDLNSDAANPGAPTWTPTYDAMLAAGFIDAWQRSGNNRGPGYTCCHADLRAADTSMNQRLDFVMVRDAREPSVATAHGSMSVDIVGDELFERTSNGVWPSDHAGLLGELRLPRGMSGSDE